VWTIARRAEYLSATRPQNQSWPGAVVAPTARIDRKAKLSNLSGRGETITIGARTVVVGELLTLWSGGAIEIGDDSYVGDSSRIWSQSKITIGSRVAISHLVDIHDTDSHPLSPRARHLDSRAILAGKPLIPSGAATAPVVIEDDVWLCFKATVLKGVTIGRGAVVAAGAVVTKDVPPMVVVAGNPARVVAEVPLDEPQAGQSPD
jgi:maltose O-acetyltransferase